MQHKKLKKKNDILRVYLDTAYFAKIKNLLLKVLYIKVKVSWNSTVGHEQYQKVQWDL